MDWLRVLLSRCAGLLRRRPLDADLDDEVRDHLELAIEENVRRGLSRDEARAAAMRSFGGMTQILAIAIAASLIPALRATRIDPLEVLRNE